jgi:hypothetical protein
MSPGVQIALRDVELAVPGQLFAIQFANASIALEQF